MSLVPTIQSEPDFSPSYSFLEAVDNVEHITYMKFQYILMTGCKDMSKNFKNTPKMEVSPDL